MLFNSYIFILLFLPLALSGYFLLSHFRYKRAANVFLIVLSLWFYGYFHYWYLFLICGSIAGNYLLSKGMEFAAKRAGIRKMILALGICANLALIFYFKYYDFFLENVNAAFGSSFELKHIVLPLGISFFTFQQISYLVDSYRGETKDYTFDEYALFVSFFPQLIAGPIVMHSEIIPQFREQAKRHIIAQNFSRGIYIFALGLFKKVILADTFGRAVTYGFGNIETLSSLEALVVSLSYTFQLYFDFSGYCDMASGIGSMFNIDMPQNFDAPYRARSITEFWERWHMTLARFLKNYVYIPLGGNRKGKIRTYLNIMIVYLLSGIWHGANWTFVLWGVLHGCLSCLNRLFQKTWDSLEGITQWAVTFMTVNVLWILFRADNVPSAWAFLKRLCSLSDFQIRAELYNCFNLEELCMIEGRIPYVNQMAALNLWLFLFAAFFVVLNVRGSKELEFKPTAARSFSTVIFLVWSVLSFTGISTFLYFNF